MRQTIKKTLWDAALPVAIQSSTDASPVVITASGHGLVNDNRVLIFGHTTNVAINGIYRVLVIDANTFSLLDELSYAPINGSGAGNGSGGYLIAHPRVEFIEDFLHVEIQIITAGGATVTFNNAISDGPVLNNSNISTPRKDFPNFGATISTANPYTYAAGTDSSNGATYVGGVSAGQGIAASGTDIVVKEEVYISGAKWLCLIPTAWSGGSFTAILTGYYK